MTTGARGTVPKGGRRKSGRRAIKFGSTEGRVVRLVGRMPFVSFRDVCDLLGLDGYQSARVIMENLEALGHVMSLKTGGVYSGGWEVKRFALTARGIGRLAELERIEVSDALQRYPVSLQWRRVLLRRLEALEVYYKLCCFAALARREGEITFGEGEDVGGPGEFAVGEPSGGTLFWWRRTGWLDGTVVFGQGKGARRVRVLRIGTVGVRRAILHRLGSMVRAYGDRGIERIVIVVPGYTELRLVEHWLRANARFIQAYCVVEHELKEARNWSDVRFVRPGEYGSAYFSLSKAFSGLRGRPSRLGARLDRFEPYAKVVVPEGAILKTGRNDRGILVGASLSRRERICLQAVADWPLGLRVHLLGLKGVSDLLFTNLFGLGLIHYAWDDGRARVLLSDAGMRYVASRDRSSLKVLRDKWGYVMVDKSEPELENLRSFPVTGKGLDRRHRIRAEGGKLKTVSRQLVHLDGITEFFSTLGEGTEGLDVVEVLPTHRGERWAKIGRRMRAILPDGAFVAKTRDSVIPFALEFERRAVTPKLMNQRLRPYKQYYDAVYRFEDHGAILVTLMVFESVVHASDFASHCGSGRVVARTSRGRNMPLYVSSIEAIREKGLWEDVWFAVGGEFAGRYVELTRRGRQVV